MKLTIDGKNVEARPDETVLQVALRHGIAIPHLCHHPHLAPFGACRLCLVEIEGMRGYPASCSTPAAEGMTVQTETGRLQALRRGILELMMIEHPSACLVCDKSDLCDRYRSKAEKSGRTTGCHTCNNKEVCEVKVLADRLQIASLPVAGHYRELPIERTDPFIDRDLNLCILCGRCVRICKEHQGEATIDFVGRGSDTRIGEAFGRTLTEANCRFCGSCVDVCPTGAISDRYAKWHGAPDAQLETTCMFCDAACALRVSIKDGKTVAAQGVQGDQPLCVLGRFGIPELLNTGTRLRKPQVLVEGRLRETTWDTALQLAAGRLKDFTGEAFALVCDAGSTLEDRRQLERFCRTVMQSPHYLERPGGEAPQTTTLPAGVRAALVTGDFIQAGQMAALDLLIVADIYPSGASARAEIVLPAAVFTEVEGTIRDGAGDLRPLTLASRAPGDARPDWRIAGDLAEAMGAEGFDAATAAGIAEGWAGRPVELRRDRSERPAPAGDPRLRATHFRGHKLDDFIKGLGWLPEADGAAQPAAATVTGG